MTPAQSQAVKKLILGKSETKYCVSDISGGYIAEIPKTFTSPVGWHLAMPRIVQGVGNNQRIGERINNIRGKTTMYFFIPPNAPSSQDVLLKIFFGFNKTCSDYNLFPSIHKNTLLEVGDQTTTDWNADILLTTPMQLAAMPVSRNTWSLKTKTIRLVRNGGVSNGAPAPDAPNVGSLSHVKVVFNWKRKLPIKYPSNAADVNVPSNYCPVFIAVPWFANEQVDDSPVVSMQWRNEVYFHDS